MNILEEMNILGLKQVIVIGTQISYWGYIASIIPIGALIIWSILIKRKKKKCSQEISNYIIISEEKTATTHKLLLRYFDGIKGLEYAIKKDAVLEVKTIGTIDEGIIQIILVDEYGMPIRSVRNIHPGILTYRAQKNGKFVIKLVGCHAKGKFGIQCNITG